MTKEDKAVLIGELKEKFANTTFFYVTDASGMSVADTNSFRRMCFENRLEYKVIKNSLIKKALEDNGNDYTQFNKEVLKGFSGVIFANEAGNAPAKLLKAFYKTGKNKPLLKGASIDSSLFIGAEQLDTLTKIKSRLELIAELAGTLQAPGQRLASALKSGSAKLAGVLKTIEEKKESN